MNERCTNDHEIAKGQKFCGECGAGPKVADRTCGKCSGSILKAHNFCPGCGEKSAEAAGADAEFGEALEVMTSFAKAHVQIAKDMATLPTVTAKDVAKGDVDAVVKAALERTKNGDEVGVDAEAAITEILKSHNLLAGKLDAYAAHHQSTLGRLFEGNVMLVKACMALGGMNRELGARVNELTAKVEEMRNDAGGRKGVRVTALAKGGPASEAARGGNGADGNGNGEFQLTEGDMLPEHVIAKCLAATAKDGDIMSQHEFAKVTTMGNGMGFTLKAMCEYDPALAPTLLATIKKADQIAAAAEAAH